MIGSASMSYHPEPVLWYGKMTGLRGLWHRWNPRSLVPGIVFTACSTAEEANARFARHGYTLQGKASDLPGVHHTHSKDRRNA